MTNQISFSLETARSAKIELEKQSLQKDLQAQLLLQRKERELLAEKLRSAHSAGMAEVSSIAVHSIGNYITAADIQLYALKKSMNITRVYILHL